eukprot:COSAG04_NODE_7798_length_1065_cov_1.593168_1_plen_146_part_10
MLGENDVGNSHSNRERQFGRTYCGDTTGLRTYAGYGAGNNPPTYEVRCRPTLQTRPIGVLTVPLPLGGRTSATRTVSTTCSPTTGGASSTCSRSRTGALPRRVSKTATWGRSESARTPHAHAPLARGRSRARASPSAAATLAWPCR